MRKYNIVISTIMIVIGVISIYLALNFKINEANAGDPGAAFWPLILTVGLIISSALLLVQTAMEARKATEPEAPLIDFHSEGAHCVFKIFIIMIAYALLLHLFGFIITTLAFVCAVMFVMGERRPLWIILTSIGITGFIYVLFAIAMKMILPEGSLF